MARRRIEELAFFLSFFFGNLFFWTMGVMVMGEKKGERMGREGD